MRIEEHEGRKLVLWRWWWAESTADPRVREKQSTRVARALTTTRLQVVFAPPPPPAMHLYTLTVQPATATPHAILGNFSGARAQEIIVSHGVRLELLRPDAQTGKVWSSLRWPCLGASGVWRRLDYRLGRRVRIPHTSISFEANMIL